MISTTIFECSIIEVPRFSNRAGNLSIIQRAENISFQPRRVFFIYDIPAGEARGAHAHKACQQFIIAASGSFEVSLDDGTNKRTISLNRPSFGIYIPSGIWAYEFNFSSGAVCLVMASEKYDSRDYIRDYSEFKSWKFSK